MAKLGEHTCHARSCGTAVPPKMFMCTKHWYMIPENWRKKLWDLYRPGQERRKDPSMEYLNHAMACVNHVADLESQRK